MSTNPSPLRRLPWQAAFFVLAAIWGCSFWWIKLGLRACTPIDVAFVRCSFGATALLAVSWLTGTRLPRGRRTWAHLFVLAVLLNSGPFTLFAYGETHISAVLAGLINSVTPLTTLLATFVLLSHERPKGRSLVGLLVGLIGVLVVLGVWNGLGSGRLLGVLACLLAVTCYGISFPYSRRYVVGLPDGPISLATGQVLCGSAQLLPFALGFGHVAAHPPATSLLALGALGMLGSGIAYVLNYHVIASATPTAASTVTYVVPVFAVIVGVAFLHEAFTWYEFVGGVVVLVAAALSQGYPRRFSLRRSRPPAVAASRTAPAAEC